MDNCSDGCSCGGKYCAKKVYIFSNLTDTQMEKIASLIRREKYHKGDTLFSPGDPADRLYIVNQGSIKVYTLTRDGREQILYILHNGDFLGDLNLFKKGVTEYYGTALEDSNICTLHKSDFNDILHENPEITAKVLEYAYDRITELEKLAQTLTTKDVDTRLATLLISLSKNFGIRTKQGIEITFPLSREDMASYLGLTRETVSRRLGYFQDLRVIEMTGTRKILIRDIDALKEL